MNRGKTPLASWSFPSHYIWKDFFTYTWTDIEGWFCLFAEYPDGIYMPLPPVGPHSDRGMSLAGSLRTVLDRVMAFMDSRNRGSGVTRIENIPVELKEQVQPWGYRFTPKDPDYVYHTARLAALNGNLYKSQRAAYNRFVRAHHIRLAPYQPSDCDACAALFHRWVSQKEEGSWSGAPASGDVARLMLKDAAAAHRVVLQEYQALELTGRVVWVDGVVKAYTFGYPLSPDVLCILLEVADRSIYGLAQYLFREYCREFHHYAYTNTMDASGLPALAKAKRAYHPCHLIPNYIAQPG